MNNSIFTFKLTEHEKIIIKIDKYPEDIPYCFYEAHFYMIKNNHEILLSYDSLPSHVEAFIIALKEALKNKRQVDPDLFKNIGYYWNESINGADQEHPFNKNYSILKKYTPWGAHTSTWIYNDEQGNIILEITPYYPHTFSDKYSYQDFLTWIQNYKPLFKTIISRHVAQQWIEQAQQILDTIDENTQILHEQGKL
ncbi:MAG: hypothetical protein ACXWL2_05250 [Candidatus Chromulinivorax sp.]